ncbi:MAG TPA: anhydro-N-acetylmuramic acid kinase [Nocardioidaceae bacterium]|nr:anhydro-N-acetylmuramic acid kinase [Nocardioidaceae bacterium]
MIVVAVASGTSVDAVDVAAADIAWTGPSTATLHARGLRSVAWPTDLRARVLALLPPGSATAEEWCRLDNEVGRFLAATAATAVESLVDNRADLIVSPGQTLHHDVVDGHCLGTLQLGQPAWIAEANGLPVVSDLRASDVAAGGHGAPLVPLFDAAWLAASTGGSHMTGGSPVDPSFGYPEGRGRAALNLGGIANVTVVAGEGEPVVGFDTGPANCLLDLAAGRVTEGRRARDDDGRLAANGRVRRDLLDRLLKHPYFRLGPPKSTGRETFSAQLLDAALVDVDPVDGPDLLATLTELTARTVAAALDPYAVAEVVVSGGGAHNPTLMAALRSALPDVSVITSDEHGVPIDAKEAVMWALLGFLTWHGVPGVAPGVDGATTGAIAPRPLGRIALPSSAPRPPQPRQDPLRRLSVLPIGAAV